jgi:hypothetical protein
MARIFSIDFFLEGNTHHAMISVRTTPFHTEYTVSMLEPKLAAQLLSDRIVSSAPGQFNFQNVPLNNYTRLMHELVRAVSDHAYSQLH